MLIVLIMLTLILVFLYIGCMVLDGFKFKDLDELYDWNLYKYMQSRGKIKKDIEFAHFYRDHVRPALIKREHKEALEYISHKIETEYIESVAKDRESFLFSYQTDKFSQEQVTDMVVKIVKCEKDDISFAYKRKILGVGRESCKVILRDLD